MGNKRINKLIAGLTSFMLVSSSIISPIFTRSEEITFKTITKEELRELRDEYNSENVISLYDKLKEDMNKVENPEKFISYLPDDRVRIIVELEEKSVYDKLEEANSVESLSAYSNNLSLINQVLSSQETTIQSIKQLDGETTINRRYSTLINGFSIESAYKNIEEIRSMPGVKTVSVAQKYLPEMNSSKDMIADMDNLWSNRGYDGSGMLVSIIDSGIDYTHKDMVLSDTSNMALTKYEVEEIKSTLSGKDGKYFSDKVPFGYNYTNDSYKNNGPTDIRHENGSTPHGSHVAGIVGANCLNESEIKENRGIKGVAPETQFLAMKVFSNNPKDPYAYSDDMMAAIEDSIKLGADVINMSLGSPAGFQMSGGDIEQEAVRKAVQSGVMVVCSAGNESYSTYATHQGIKEDRIDVGIVSTPGITNEALQVASAENIKMVAPALSYYTIDGRENGLMATAATQNSNIAVNFRDFYEVVDCGYGAQSDFSGVSVRGKVALMERGGGLTFIEKQQNATIAGAAAIIIYNHEDGGNSLVQMMEPTPMYIPAMFIGHDDGERLRGIKDVFIGYENEIIELDNPERDSMSYFSSYGPTPDLDFKPEITGIGGNVWSTVSNGNYENNSGTSMSSPFVAGFMTLYLQHLKSEGITFENEYDKVKFVKNNAINTADVIYENTPNDGKIPVSPRRQGAGMIDIEGMLKNKVTVTYAIDGDATIALKEIGNEVAIPITITNHGNKPMYYVPELLNNQVYTQQDYLFGEGVVENNFDTVLDGAAVEFIYEKSVLNTTTGSAISIKDENQELNPEVIESETTTGSAIDFGGEIGSLNADNVLEVLPGQSKVVQAILTIQEGEDPNKFVEGFINFVPVNEEDENIGIPFMGFYGDWGSLKIFDIPGYEGNEENTMSGISAGFYRDDNGDGIEELIIGYPGKDPNYYILSPGNEESSIEVLVPIITPLRNIREAYVKVKDSKGNVIRDLAYSEYIRKVYRAEVQFFFTDSWAWDGKDNDGNIVPDGNYSIVVEGRADYPGSQFQSISFPVIIDTVAPTGTMDRLVEKRSKVGFEVVFDTPAAEGAEIAMISVENLETGEEVYATNMIGKPYFPIEYYYNSDLKKYEINFRKLPFTYNNVKLHLMDYIGNTQVVGRTIIINENVSEDKLNIINPVSNQKFDKLQSILTEYTFTGEEEVKYTVQAMTPITDLSEVTTEENQIVVEGIPSGKNIILVKAHNNEGKLIDIDAVEIEIEDNNQSSENYFEITNLTNKDSFTLGEQAKISIEVKNLVKETKNVAMIVGLFDENERMVSFVCIDKSVSPESSEKITALINLPSEGKYSLRTFVWDSIENANALSNVLIFPVE